MAKVYIDAGHGGSDPGAVKYVVERDVNLVMAMACDEYLKSHGVETMMSRTSNSQGTDINAMARAANNWGADLVLSIHNNADNAGGGDGFEVYYSVVGGTGKVLAQNIEAEVKKLGQNSRGCKTRKGSDGADYYGMIRLTNAPAVICEGFFVDNATDVKIADTAAEQKAFGQAYARGALKTLGIADKGAGSANSTAASSGTGAGGYVIGETYTLQDYMNVRSGPGTNYPVKQVSELTADGKRHATRAYGGATLMKGTAVTCLEVSGDWMRIPSGWVCCRQGSTVYIA